MILSVSPDRVWFVYITKAPTERRLLSSVFLIHQPFFLFFSSSFLLRTNARQRPVPIFLTNWWKVMKTKKKILTHQSFQVNRKEKKKRYIHHIALFTDVMDDADKDTRRRVLTGSTSYRCIYIYIYLLFIYDLFLNKMH